ncbi:MAG: hypothetical protein CALGDGBN_00286 [Pseudomonadales bacterium]|nr:hypothetical protein [Pseudomonadales bacterium]
MSTFVSVTDDYLAAQIDRAVRRLVYAAPGVGKATAEALLRAMQRDPFSLTIILDSDEDACRVGYGEPEALKFLHDAASHHQFALRRQTGLRIGMLVRDDESLIWAPTPRSIEAERGAQQPNGVMLSGSSVQALETAVGADQSDVLPSNAEIGREPLTLEELEATVKELIENPPEPFDLARKTRVFSTRFQYVEFEVRGAEWTGRKIKLSSLLLNADLPESVQDILETQIRPFAVANDINFNVPLVVHGRPAYEENGERMMVPATQADVMKIWDEIKGRYLRQVKGFGWLIRRDSLEAFRLEIAAYEEALRSWVGSFRSHVKKDEDQLIKGIVDSIADRVKRSGPSNKLKSIDLDSEVRRGLDRLRVIEPKVRIVLKNISWESSRDAEFLDAIQRALPSAELEGWFEEFTAVRQRAAGAT